jgi:acyl carrier protein
MPPGETVALDVAQAVFSALSKQLSLAVELLRARQHESLERLGLDSHGLLRVLLELERDLSLKKSLDLPDEALESPATLIGGVTAAMS